MVPRLIGGGHVAVCGVESRTTDSEPSRHHIDATTDARPRRLWDPAEDSAVLAVPLAYRSAPRLAAKLGRTSTSVRIRRRRLIECMSALSP